MKKTVIVAGAGYVGVSSKVMVEEIKAVIKGMEYNRPQKKIMQHNFESRKEFKKRMRGF